MSAAPSIQALRQSYGALEGYADARLVTLGDGAQRGVRVLELRSGGGLEAEVIVDRSFDLGRVALGGTTVSWHGHGGYRNAALVDPFAEAGQGWLTGMSGLLMTCGFDHIRQPEEEPAFDAPLHPTPGIAYPLHGGGAQQPARLVGYGIDEGGDRPTIWAEGEVTQSMMFRGALRLHRRIEMPLGGRGLSLTDTVTNIGPTPRPAMMLYHFNLGHPLVDRDSALSFDPAEDLWQSGPHDPRAPFGEPPEVPVSELSVHRQAGQDGWARCRLHNPESGLSAQVGYATDTLPYLQLLRVRGQGYNLVGIEPCTNRHRSRKDARDAGEMPMLSPGDSRRFAVEVTLDSTDPATRAAS